MNIFNTTINLVEADKSLVKAMKLNETMKCILVYQSKRKLRKSEHICTDPAKHMLRFPEKTLQKQSENKLREIGRRKNVV